MNRSRVLAVLTFLVGAASGCHLAGPQRIDVEISSLAFAPADLTARVGDTLVWVNRDLVPHTVTADELASGPLRSGAVHTFVPTKAGEIRYACEYHPGMAGRLTVVAR